MRPDARLDLLGPYGSLQGFAGGRLPHDGGFDLVWAEGRRSLQRFELRPAPPPRTFDLGPAGGEAALFLDGPHTTLYLDRGEYAFLNMDLRIAEALAEELGNPELAGKLVGAAHVRLGLVPGEAPRGSEPACTPDYDGDVDVELFLITALDEIHHDGTRVAVAPGVGLRNVGVADVPWFRPIVPDGGGDPAAVGPHPFLVMNVYRLAGSTFRQIGRSDVKHAFFSANTSCPPCQPDQILFDGCEDFYSAYTNKQRLNLAPRDEIEASTGTWDTLGSHFDGDPADDFRDHHGDIDHPDELEHRLTLRDADLQTPGARYFIEAWYVTAGDIDIFNSMGFREVTPTFTSGWSFPFVDSGLAQGPALDAWVDRAAPGPAASATVVPISGSEVELAARSTPSPTGLYRYDYALANFDLDRRLRSLSVPLPAGITVSDPTFYDGDDDPTNDWAATVTPTEIFWQTPPGDPSSNALDWGTMFSFSFEANGAPAERTATLGILEAGTPSDALAATQAPGDAPLPVATLDLVRSGLGDGRVASDPSGVDCAPDCQGAYGDGTSVELTAEAAPLSKFVRWKEGGAEVGTSEQYATLMDRDRTLEAVFQLCDTTLPAQQVSSPELFESCNSLVAGPGFEILGPAGSAVFRAGVWVAIEGPFTVESDAELTIEIDPSLAE